MPTCHGLKIVMGPPPQISVRNPLVLLLSSSVKILYKADTLCQTGQSHMLAYALKAQSWMRSLCPGKNLKVWACCKGPVNKRLRNAMTFYVELHRGETSKAFAISQNGACSEDLIADLHVFFKRSSKGAAKRLKKAKGSQIRLHWQHSVIAQLSPPSLLQSQIDQLWALF